MSRHRERLNLLTNCALCGEVYGMWAWYVSHGYAEAAAQCTVENDWVCHCSERAAKSSQDSEVELRPGGAP